MKILFISSIYDSHLCLKDSKHHGIEKNKLVKFENSNRRKRSWLASYAQTTPFDFLATKWSKKCINRKLTNLLKTCLKTEFWMMIEVHIRKICLRINRINVICMNPLIIKNYHIRNREKKQRFQHTQNENLICIKSSSFSNQPHCCCDCWAKFWRKRKYTYAYIVPPATAFIALILINDSYSIRRIWIEID